MAPVREWKITLTLEGPILTQATAAGRAGVDAVMARTADGTRWCLPGTLVKGRLREAWQELHNAAPNVFDPPLRLLLGEESGNEDRAGSVDAARAGLHFADFVCTSHSAATPACAGDPNDTAQDHAGGAASQASQADTLFRVRMDPDRGAVDRGAYLVMEAPFGVGEEVVFEGAVRTALPDPVPETLKHYLEKGLAWIPSFGAERTVGFGRLLGVTVDGGNPAPTAGQVASPGSWLLVEPLAPFCIARPKLASNLFEADEVIPGGVLKGCLAATWGQSLGKSGPVGPGFDSARPELSEYFWAVRFTHAFPLGPDGKRPVAQPQSLVKLFDGSFRDVALGPGPNEPEFRQGAPAFAVDWKGGDFCAVRKSYGWPELLRDLRVRTAMDPVRRKGREQALFACETVVPGATRWASQVDLGRVPQGARGAVEQQLWDLLGEGLLGLGKTKAAARVERKEQVAPSVVSASPPTGAAWVVTLQTPGLLCDAASLNEESGEAELRSAYESAWADLSRLADGTASCLELVDYFARQSLAGGYYLHLRFSGGAPSYVPWLLTDAGSVFVLRAATGRETEAQERIGAWLAHGLPLPGWAVVRIGRDEKERWQGCPYLPENGYGEIAVNLALPAGLSPAQGGAA